MTSTSVPRSHDGFQWTKERGLEPGVPSIGVVNPSSRIQSSDQLYDAIVIGAGYAGLTAARDLTTCGHRVLLLEARDRIGGRAWTSTIHEHQFEMGGTYVHWAQPHLYREAARYSLQQDFEPAVDYSKGVPAFSLITPNWSKVLNDGSQGAILESAIQKFINVDGDNGKAVMPFPHDPSLNPGAMPFDNITIRDRFDQLQTDLTPAECTLLEAYLSTLSGGKLESAGFYDVLRLWALCSYSADGFIRACMAFKLKGGQSSFARQFFQEGLGSQRMSYLFSCPVASVKDHGRKVEVTTKEGQRFYGRKVICTIPHNVLGDVTFSPPLTRLENKDLRGHVNQIVKLHAEVQSDKLCTWEGLVYPHSKLIHATGEGVLPNGNTDLVCFGGAANHLQPEEDIKETLKAVQMFQDDINVERLVFHNWCKDEYSKGGWSWLGAGVASRLVSRLREARGNLHFASADWALGWRGFIDGAIEEGSRVAMVVKSELGLAQALRNE